MDNFLADATWFDILLSYAMTFRHFKCSLKNPLGATYRMLVGSTTEWLHLCACVHFFS